MENAKTLFADPDKCTGCQRCVYVCAAVKEGLFAPSLARLRINNFPLRGYSVPSICFQCPRPECLEACPAKAIVKNETGVVLVEKEKCDGCGECVAACPYGLIELDQAGQAYKCDLCRDDPACVKECRFSALVFAEPDQELRRLKGRQMKQRQEGGPAENKRRRLALNLLAEARP
ncbi:MAG: 4Fe-4S dicluster domain-containing protein [Thermodesulfobacteriota bacterium]